MMLEKRCRRSLGHIPSVFTFPGGWLALALTAEAPAPALLKIICSP